MELRRENVVTLDRAAILDPVFGITCSVINVFGLAVVGMNEVNVVAFRKERTFAVNEPVPADLRDLEIPVVKSPDSARDDARNV